MRERCESCDKLGQPDEISAPSRGRPLLGHPQHICRSRRRGLLPPRASALYQHCLYQENECAHPVLRRCHIACPHVTRGPNGSHARDDIVAFNAPALVSFLPPNSLLLLSGIPAPLLLGRSPRSFTLFDVMWETRLHPACTLQAYNSNRN
jgi:hypothetical protein